MRSRHLVGGAAALGGADGGSGASWRRPAAEPGSGRGPLHIDPSPHLHSREMAAAAARALHGLLPPLPLLRSRPACTRHIEAALTNTAQRRVASMTPYQATAAAAAAMEGQQQQPAPPQANPALEHSEVLFSTSERSRACGLAHRWLVGRRLHAAEQLSGCCRARHGRMLPIPPTWRCG